MKILNQRGQGMIEYLIVVCLVAVGAMAIIRVIGQNVDSRFASVASTLQGQSTNYHMDRIESSQYKKRDMNDFMEGAGQR